MKHDRTVRFGRLTGVISVCALALALSGCVTQESMLDPQPRVDVVSRPNNALRRLPPPAEKTAVAVYQYNDLTGQYKDTKTVQTLSRAVTQGGASILVKALQEAGEGRWFTVLERSELDDLLRERQILTEMRRIYRNEKKVDSSVLPPLLHASVLIEGGIIGYDTNIITGGIGARFLGIGADTKYMQDVVTVSLRAVSTKTGEVMTTVTTRKAVASYALQGGAFRYLKLDELLEAEAGTTYNEPKQIAVQSAIEAAVKSLIIEGAEKNIWSFADKASGQELIEAHRDEKYQDNMTFAAQNPEPAVTANANDITDTVQRRARPVRVQRRTMSQTRTRAPQQQAPRKAAPKPDVPPAPEPGKEETLGSTTLPSGDRRQAAEPLDLLPGVAAPTRVATAES